ncbi:MAG: agmatinase [Longimicrobiaceae bacterium]
MGGTTSFLGLEGELASWERARVVILPVPYEASVSYGGGTARGPAAVLDASRYVELYDQELDAEPSAGGVCTLPPLQLSTASPEEAISGLRASYDQLLERAGERLVIGLGGEHSISSAPILAHADRLTAGARLAVLQFDAHADLRPEYHGSPWSHASVMARVAGRVDVVSVGVRALTTEERDFMRSNDSITSIFADQMWSGNGWIDRVMDALGDPVYITFDVDYFDPSLLPSTGTPEPGGGDWYRTLALLRRVFGERRVVGADVVELAPIPGLHAADFLVAKLVYKMIGYWGSEKGAGARWRVS